MPLPWGGAAGDAIKRALRGLSPDMFHQTTSRRIAATVIRRKNLTPTDRSARGWGQGLPAALWGVEIWLQAMLTCALLTANPDHHRAAQPVGVLVLGLVIFFWGRARQLRRHSRWRAAICGGPPRGQWDLGSGRWHVGHRQYGFAAGKTGCALRRLLSLAGVYS